MDNEEYKEIVFSLTPKQVEKFQIWRKSKYTPHQMKTYTYSFTPTGLGSIIEVKCSDGETIDLTDDNW